MIKYGRKDKITGEIPIEVALATENIKNMVNCIIL